MILISSTPTKQPTWQRSSPLFAARLCDWGGAKILGGNSYTSHRTNVAITDSATTMKWGIKPCCERIEQIFLVCTPNCDKLWHFGGTSVANEVKFFNEIVWGQDGSLGGQLSPVPLPGYVTGCSLAADWVLRRVGKLSNWPAKVTFSIPSPI